MELIELLKLIEQHGSVRKAAIALGISVNAISKRFKKLADDDPLRVQYEALKGSKGRPRKYPQGVEGDRQRWRKAKEKPPKP